MNIRFKINAIYGDHSSRVVVFFGLSNISGRIIVFVKRQISVNALAINVLIPEDLQWTDAREGKRYTLNTLNIRILPNGHLAAKAYGRPEDGGRGTYVAFPVQKSAEIEALIFEAAVQASALWINHKGFHATADQSL